MYDAYVKRLQDQYGFADISYSLAVDDGFSVTVTLTSSQIDLISSKAVPLEHLRVKAEMIIVNQCKIPLSLIPQTHITAYANQLEISGSPYFVNVFLWLLFT